MERQPFELISFNPVPPTTMHLDLNSCFAAIEQQANPSLRGKPVAVAAYTSPNGCILAASVEAKRFGVKTGMRVADGKALCPHLLVLPSDPDKYRFVNRNLLALLSEYTPSLSVESIDEMVMDLAETPLLHGYMIRWSDGQNKKSNHSTTQPPSDCVLSAMEDIAQDIKNRIKQKIGEWLTVSIGIAPNRYLAKVASSLRKPDGLDTITKENIEKVLATLALTDLCGIKEGTALRLRSVGIDTPVKMYHANVNTLVSALHSIVGYQWWMRLHGWEDGVRYKAFGESEEEQKSFGQSYAFGKPFTPAENGLYQVLWQLVAKMGRRLRRAGATAGGIFVSCRFVDYSHWGQSKKMVAFLSTDFDFYSRMEELLRRAPEKPVRLLAVGCFDLSYQGQQESLFEEDKRKEALTQAIDAIHDRWGDGVVTTARILGTAQSVLDRIAFGRAREAQTNFLGLDSGKIRRYCKEDKSIYQE